MIQCKLNGKPLDAILPYVLPNCVALPEEMAMDYGRRAYIEFARRSGGIVKNLVCDIQEGVQDYPLEPPDGYIISRINAVAIAKWGRISPTLDWNNSVCCGKDIGYSGGSMNGSYGYGPNRWNASCGPYRFHMDGYDCLVLHLSPKQDCVNGLLVEVSLQPLQEVCYFDGDFFERWVEGISWGALSKAMLLTNTDWYNPELSARYDKKFSNEIQRARHKFDLNNSRGPMTMRAKRFV